MQHFILDGRADGREDGLKQRQVQGWGRQTERQSEEPECKWR